MFSIHRIKWFFSLFFELAFEFFSLSIVHLNISNANRWILLLLNIFFLSISFSTSFICLKAKLIYSNVERLSSFHSNDQLIRRNENHKTMNIFLILKIGYNVFSVRCSGLLTEWLITKWKAVKIEIRIDQLPGVPAKTLNADPSIWNNEIDRTDIVLFLVIDTTHQHPKFKMLKR